MAQKDISVGKKIKKARQGKKVTFNNMANETGLSVDEIRSIENGNTVPSVGNLLQIARVLQIDSGFLLKNQEETLENRVKEYEKRTDNYAYTSLTPGAENKHLKAFKIKIDPMQDHKGVGYCHEGEEFVYVLKGKVEIMVGDHKNVLKKDESLQFNSSIKHHLANKSKKTAELIVIVYGP